MRPIHDRDGRPGMVETDDGERVVVRLPEGGALHLPVALVERGEDGSYQTDLSFEDLAAERTTLLEVDEAIRVHTDVHETGRVVARTVTETVSEDVDTTGWRETVEVEHVPFGRPVEAVTGPRTEGDVTIIPVYEEVLVVRTQLVLREEVRLTTRREPVTGSERVALRRQRVEVDRLPPKT